MQNLYQIIKSLVDEKEELNRRCGILKYGARCGIPEAKEEFDKIVERLHVVNDQIDRINREYAIGIKEMGVIISKNMGETYIPKIFKEVYEKDGARYYSERFIACYINQKHPYYSHNDYEISVMEDEFKTLMQNANKNNNIMFSNSAELGNYRPLRPKYAFIGTNFISKYTYNYDNSFEYFCRKFIKKVEPMLVEELKSTNVIVNDDDFNNGL